MKKRIRKTGEIVDVISSENVLVSYIDSDGNTWANIPRNPFEDFEDVEEELTKEIDWEKVRIKAAIAFEATMISSSKWVIPKNAKTEEAPECYANAAISYADTLIAELKKGDNQ